MDFKYFKSINSNLSLHCGTDIKKTANSDICIVCFMMENQNENSFFLNLDAIIININLYKKYIPKIVKYSPNTILIVATYPFSIMTHYCLKFSKLSENRVLGIGTSIATCLFRKMLANYFNINSKDVYGWVSSFFTLNQSNLLISNPSLLWSTVMVGGVHIENLIDLSFKQNYDYLNHILKYNDKYTEAITNSSIVPIIGAVCYELCQCILTDSRIAISLSCNIKGYFGIQYSVYLGLPCIVGRSGYVEFVKMILSDRDIDKLKHGALCNYKVFKIIDQKLKENLKQAT